MGRKPAEHATRSRYITGCRCDLCKQANAEYQKARYANNEEARETRKASARAYGAAKRATPALDAAAPPA